MTPNWIYSRQSISPCPYLTNHQPVLLLKFTCAVTQFEGLLKDQYLDELKYQMWKLELLAQHQSIVSANCNCSFIYWISNLVPTIFSDIFHCGPDLSQVHRLLFATDDRLVGVAIQRLQCVANDAHRSRLLAFVLLFDVRRDVVRLRPRVEGIEDGLTRQFIPLPLTLVFTLYFAVDRITRRSDPSFACSRPKFLTRFHI